MKIIIMKHILTTIGLATILIIAGCTKETNYTEINNNYSPQVDSLVRFLKKEIPDDISKLDLKTISKITLQDQVLAFQIFEKSSTRKFLLLRKDSNSYVGTWVNLSGLTKDQKSGYSGKILLANFDGLSNTELTIKNNRLFSSEKSGKNISRSIKVWSKKRISFSEPRNISRGGDYIYLPEIIVYRTDRADYMNLSWLFEGYNIYNYCFIETEEAVDDDGGGGGPGNSSQNDHNKEVIVLPVFIGPKKPIKNLNEELKCFTINATSSYSISVRVNQPRPNSSDKIDFTADYIVGHTYLSLEQVNIDGTKIVRNVGFYPETDVYPGSTEDVSAFGEDSNTPFAVSLNIGVSGTELNTVISTLLNQQSKPYELNNFNCVNSSASALRSIGINLPLNTSGIQNLFKGYSPGELGQDIRNLDLNSFKSKNGNRVVSRETKNKNESKPSPKTGTCK